MKYFLVIFLFVVITKFNMGVKGDCCHKTNIIYKLKSGGCDRIKGGARDPYKRCIIAVCNDGVYHDYFYCGKGPCNIFGCNCDDGCIHGGSKSALENFKEKYGHMLVGAHSRLLSSDGKEFLMKNERL